MTKNNIQAQLRDWATETVKEYVKLANEYKLGFYQQTPLTSIEEDVKIVVIGINPGFGVTYSDQNRVGGKRSSFLPTFVFRPLSRVDKRSFTLNLSQNRA